MSQVSFWFLIITMPGAKLEFLGRCLVWSLWRHESAACWDHKHWGAFAAALSWEVILITQCWGFSSELMRLHEITLLIFLSLFRCFRCDFVCSQEAERCESWQRFDFANLQIILWLWLIDWYLKYRWKRMATKGNEWTPCKQVQGVDRKNRCAWTRAGEEVWRFGNVSIQWSQWSYKSATKIFQLRPGHTVASSRRGSLFWIA